FIGKNYPAWPFLSPPPSTIFDFRQMVRHGTAIYVDDAVSAPPRRGQGSALHIVSDGAAFLRARRRTICRLAACASRRRFAVAVSPRPVLPRTLPLLRLPHQGDAAAHAGAALRRSAGPRDRNGGGARRQ